MSATASEHAIRVPYRHSHQKVGRALLETAYLGYEKRSDVGYDCLNNENQGNDCEVG
jgi:hypothetical protein